MGCKPCKPCKCCGCFGSRDDIPYFIDATNAPTSRPLSKRKAKAAAKEKEREKEKEEYRKSKGKSEKPKVSLRTRLLGKKEKKEKKKRGDSWNRRPSGQVQYSHIPDRDSEDINSEDFSLVNISVFIVVPLVYHLLTARRAKPTPNCFTPDQFLALGQGSAPTFLEGDPD